MVATIFHSVTRNLALIASFHKDNLLGQISTVVAVTQSVLAASRLINNSCRAPRTTAASALIAYTLGDKPLVALAAHVLLVARIRLGITRSHKELKEAHYKLLATVDGSYHLPMQLLQDKRYLDPEKQSLLQIAPRPVAEVAMRSHYVVEALGNECIKAATCAFRYFELFSALSETSVMLALSKLEIANNAKEIFDELCKNPEQILEEIESQKPLIDTILNLLHTSHTTKDLTDAVRKYVKTVMKVTAYAQNVAIATNEHVQHASFVLTNMVTNLPYAPLGLPEAPAQRQPNSTLRNQHGDKGSTHKACDSKHTASGRFYK